MEKDMNTKNSCYTYFKIVGNFNFSVIGNISEISALFVEFFYSFLPLNQKAENPYNNCPEAKHNNKTDNCFK